MYSKNKIKKHLIKFKIVCYYITKSKLYCLISFFVLTINLKIIRNKNQKVNVKFLKYNVLKLEQKLFITIIYKSLRYFLICEFVYYYTSLILNNIRIFVNYNYNFFEKFIYRNKCNVYILFI